MTTADDREAYYRALGERAVHAAGITEPPVSPNEIARHLGVPVLAAELPMWCTGALISEDGMPLILINGAREPYTQNTGVAHFLGHLLVLLDDPMAGYPGAAQPAHTAADVVGDELELPGFMVRDQAQKWFNDHRYLAGLFGVTEKRMFARMQALGLVRSRGITWDY